jgi:hypothetical protein
MVLIEYQKRLFLCIFDGLGMENFGIYYKHLVYFGHFNIFYSHLVFLATLVHFPAFWFVVPRNIWLPGCGL